MQDSSSENQSADGSEESSNFRKRADILAGKSPVKDNQKFNIYGCLYF